MDTVARRLRITGRVQGVFFRAWTREQAERLDVKGWVRNCDDGSVEAHLEGRGDRVEQLIQALERGPPGALVEDIQEHEAAIESHDWFAVRH